MNTYDQPDKGKRGLTMAHKVLAVVLFVVLVGLDKVIGEGFSSGFWVAIILIFLAIPYFRGKL